MRASVNTIWLVDEDTKVGYLLSSDVEGNTVGCIVEKASGGEVSGDISGDRKTISYDRLDKGGKRSKIWSRSSI
jgi:hypothetical protein